MIVVADAGPLIFLGKIRQSVDELIRVHAFRIGIEVYQAVLAELDRHVGRRLT